jgi:hypothetical protein
MKRMLSRAAGATALSVAVVLAGAPGIAHAGVTKCVYDGSDRACATNNSYTSSVIEVCDNEDDGRSVTVWFALSDNTQSDLIDTTYGGGCRSRSNPVRVAWFTMKENQGAWGKTIYMY